MIKGLYGCSCHPFKSWEECNQATNRRFKNNEYVKNRCTGLTGMICGKLKDGNYYMVKTGAGQSDKIMMHAAELIDAMAVTTEKQDKTGFITINNDVARPHPSKRGCDQEVITRYNGGKNGNGTYQQIINLIPPHKIYIEPFVGSGAIFRKKLPAVLTILNDKDPRMFNYWCNQKPPHSKIYGIDALQLLDLHTDLGGDAFIYLDAPYLFDACTSKSEKKPLYLFEAGDEDFHVKLLERAKASRCKVMISGYESDLYNDKLKGWHKHSFQSMSRNGMRTEVLWMNYAKPVMLHDDRYLGDNFRKREKIKMKRERWMNKFKLLAPEVRVSILSHINREYPL